MEQEASAEMESSYDENDTLPSFLDEELECNIQFILGIVDYFDALLPRQLLYDFERDRQISYFQEISKDSLFFF